VQALDKVMGWDYRDDLWFARREATTIVALSCETPGADCFCQHVGLAPDTTKGADVMLRRRADGFQAEAVTEKGEALLARCGECFADAPELARGDTAARTGDAPGAKPAEVLDLTAIQEWLASHFDHPLWAALGVRCHGCGACASVCPTCHCFDIVDEPDGLLAGTRRRNWDTCQASTFTRHASGHNPRPEQNARFRQRVLHKFSIYPQRFDQVLCTGCGRCAEACPAGQNLAEVLGDVARLAAEAKAPQQG
jgi:ferredoxin